jgi:Winged helix DNA-binding domain
VRATRGSAVEVARRLCGVHAQVTSSADLILWARVRGHAAGDFARLVWEERTLVRTWLMRGTLHVVPADDLPLYVGALDNRGHYDGAWLRAFDVSAAGMERLIAAIADALDGSSLSREELAEAVRRKVGAATAKRLRSGWGEFLKPASRRGVLCSGPARGQTVTFVRPDQWLAGWTTPPPREEARAELIRRFLRAFGPASKDDFERWLGVNRRLREPWELVASEVEEIEPKLFVLGEDASYVKRVHATGGIRFLPGFDPFVLFPHSDRPVGPKYKERVYRKSAWVSATVVEHGQVIAVWAQKRRGQRLELAVSPFGRLSRATRAAVASEAEVLARYLGGRLDLRFA